MALGIKSWVLHIVGKCSTTELYPSTSFGFNLKMSFKRFLFRCAVCEGVCAHKTLRFLLERLKHRLLGFTPQDPDIHIFTEFTSQTQQTCSGHFHGEQKMAVFKGLQRARDPPRWTAALCSHLEQPQLAPGRVAHKLLCTLDYRSLCRE